MTGWGRWGRVLAAFAYGYALGLVPSAEIASRRLTRGAVDLYAGGTLNPGAQNASRTLGVRAGRAVGAADVSKGVLACAVGRVVAGGPGAHAAGVGAVAGHCYPATRGFRGGVGVAASFGQCLATFPLYAPLDAAVALAAMRLRVKEREAAAVALASAGWVAAGALWSRRRLPNLWGPRPTAALPLANALTVALIASRMVALARRRP